MRSTHQYSRCKRSLIYRDGKIWGESARHGAAGREDSAWEVALGNTRMLENVGGAHEPSQFEVSAELYPAAIDDSPLLLQFGRFDPSAR